MSDLIFEPTISVNELIIGEVPSSEIPQNEVDYETQVINKPKINGVTIVGDVSLDRIGIKKYTHIQTEPSTEWTIQHNLKCQHPFIKCLDDNNNDIYGDVEYFSINLTKIHFVVPISGTAYITNY